jgi:hypothetical protein
VVTDCSDAAADAACDSALDTAYAVNIVGSECVASGSTCPSSCTTTLQAAEDACKDKKWTYDGDNTVKEWNDDSFTWYIYKVNSGRSALDKQDACDSVIHDFLIASVKTFEQGFSLAALTSTELDQLYYCTDAGGTDNSNCDAKCQAYIDIMDEKCAIGESFSIGGNDALYDGPIVMNIIKDAGPEGCTYVSTKVNCTTSQYFDGSACQACPTYSSSAGGSATSCTCAANTYASKSGNTWTCANCTGGGTKEAGSVVPGSGSGEKENDVCSTADSSGSNNPSPSQQSPSPSQKATETKEKAQKTRDTMLNGVTDAKLKKKAKLLADAAISGKKVRKMSAKLTASDADTACSDYYTKAGISSSLGACIATATSRRRSLAATAYDVSVFFSEAEVDDSTLTAAANSLKAEGVTGVDTSDPIDPITELGTIDGVDSSTLETFKTEAAEAAAMTPSSPPPPPMSPPPPKPAPPNLILDDDDGAVSVKGATRLALACALTTLALVL